jgi:hypothetical protein
VAVPPRIQSINIDQLMPDVMIEKLAAMTMKKHQIMAAAASVVRFAWKNSRTGKGAESFQSATTSSM